MLIGVPKEIKNHEYRVGMAPASVREAIKHGHQVMVQSNAGDGIGVGDAEYAQIGAEIIDSADEIFARAELVVKVKEPQATERAMLREGQVLFTYLHLAPDPEQTKDLVASGATCIAYETVTSPHGGLPLLAPMSKVAGRMAIQAGAYCLEHPHGGLGMLLGGVPGVDPAKVVILGAGVVGTHATHIAVGMGADVWVIDRNPEAIEAHWKQFGRSTNTVFSTQDAVERHVLDADLVIGGVLIPGAEAPKLVTAEMVKAMKPGAVIRSSSMSLSTRVAVAKLRSRRRMPNRPISSTTLCITAWPICRAACRAPRPTRSTTSPCRTCWRSPARATARR
jgi:alanine dehydrogenase